MRKIKYATFPTLLDDLEALQKELDAALKRTWLMLAGIALPGIALLILALLNNSK